MSKVKEGDTARAAHLNWRPCGDQGMETAKVSEIVARVGQCVGGPFSWSVDNGATLMVGYGDTLDDAKLLASSAAGTLIESLITKREAELVTLRRALVARDAKGGGA